MTSLTTSATHTPIVPLPAHTSKNIGWPVDNVGLHSLDKSITFWYSLSHYSIWFYRNPLYDILIITHINHLELLVKNYFSIIRLPKYMVNILIRFWLIRTLLWRVYHCYSLQFQLLWAYVFIKQCDKIFCDAFILLLRDYNLIDCDDQIDLVGSFASSHTEQPPESYNWKLSYLTTFSCSSIKWKQIRFEDVWFHQIGKLQSYQGRDFTPCTLIYMTHNQCTFSTLALLS